MCFAQESKECMGNWIVEEAILEQSRLNENGSQVLSQSIEFVNFSGFKNWNLFLKIPITVYNQWGKKY